MINKNSIKALVSGHHHLIIPSTGISLGLFIWNLRGAGYEHESQVNTSLSSPIFYIFIAIYALYLSLFISSFIISLGSGLKLSDVLKKDVYTYLPLLLFLAFPIQYAFTAGSPYFSYLAGKYFSGILIIPIGSMVVFLKILLSSSLSNTPSNAYVLEKKRPYYVLCILAVVYAGTFSYYSIIRHINLNSGMDPLGLNSQAVWHLSNFEAPFISYHNTNILADHMAPILVFLAPFYKIYSDPVTLLILQSFLLASGIFPLYGLARDKLDSNFLAVSLCVGYLLYPALQFANLYDFSHGNLATPLLLFTFYFFHRKSYPKYFIFLLLSLSCKEDVVPIVFLLGVYIFFFEKRKKIGLYTVALSMFWFFFAYWVLLPYVTSGEHTQLNAGHIQRYSYLGNSMGKILSTILLHPIFILKQILIPEKLGYIMLLILPVCFISLFHLPTFLVGFSMVVANMLSTNISQSSIRFYYTATITPFVFISCVYGLRFLLNKREFIMKVAKKTGSKINLSQPCIVYGFSSLILFSGIAGSVLYSPLPYSLDPYADEFLVEKEGVDTAQEMLKLIPPDASVSAANNLGAHICNREKAFIFPSHHGEVPEYVIVNLAKPCYGTKLLREEFNEKMKELLFHDDYGVMYSKDGYTILKNGYKDKSGIKKIALATDEPDHIVDVKFNNEIAFWGYSVNTQTIRPKIPFRIVYYWKALGKPDSDCYTYIKFVDENGKIVFQQDHEPVYGLYPTSSWNEREMIQEVYWVELPITILPGLYHIYVGIGEKTGDHVDRLENLAKVGIVTVERF